MKSVCVYVGVSECATHIVRVCVRMSVRMNVCEWLFICVYVFEYVYLYVVSECAYV